MNKKYRFTCPHCGKEQIKEFKGGSGSHCNDCGEYYGIMMKSNYEMYIFPLYKAEKIEE